MSAAISALLASPAYRGACHRARFARPVGSCGLPATNRTPPESSCEASGSAARSSQREPEWLGLVDVDDPLRARRPDIVRNLECQLQAVDHVDEFLRPLIPPIGADRQAGANM